METTIQGKNELFIMEPKYFFKGGQGKLYFATGKKSNLKVVVKEYLDHKILQSDWEILQTLGDECNNIVKAIEMIGDQYLVYEYCNCGDLYTYFIKGRKPITTKEELFEAVSICLQIAKGINYLEFLGFTHRDIKPENILLHQDVKNDILTVKIADFGLCKQSGNLKSIVGTPNYIAPEILDACLSKNKDQVYTKAVDVWSFGVVLYEIITKKQIFRDLVSVKSFPTQENIASLNSCYQENPRFNKLIRDCIQKDPSKRINFEQIEYELADILRELQQSIELENQNNTTFKSVDISSILFSKLYSEVKGSCSEVDKQQQNNQKVQEANPLPILEVHEDSLQSTESTKKGNESQQLTIPNSADTAQQDKFTEDHILQEKSSSQSKESNILSSLNLDIIGFFDKNESTLREYQKQLKESVFFDFKSISTHYISRVAENLYKYAASGQFTRKILDIDEKSFSGIIASDDLEKALSPLLLHKMLQKPREQLLQKLQSDIYTQKENATNSVIQQKDQKNTKTFVYVACIKVLQDLIDQIQGCDQEDPLNNQELIQIVQRLFSNECSAQAICWCFANYIAFQLSKDLYPKGLESLIEKEDSVTLSCGINLKGCKGMLHNINSTQQDQQKTLFICKSFCSKRKYTILIPTYLMEQLFSSQTTP